MGTRGHKPDVGWKGKKKHLRLSSLTLREGFIVGVIVTSMELDPNNMKMGTQNVSPR